MGQISILSLYTKSEDQKYYLFTRDTRNGRYTEF